jgi:uncharacterized membrane protein YeaQ/YmgE (transglycosylase-associated protein family)
VIGICATVGAVVGGYLPILWGDSGLSFVSLIFGAVGAVVGVLVGARLMDL